MSSTSACNVSGCALPRSGSGRTKCRLHYNESMRLYMQTPKARATRRAREFRKRYGITLEDYERMREEQDGVCALCGGPPNGNTEGYFHVDHVHATGKVRGLLCSTCNLALGLAYDRPDLLRKMAEYVEQEGKL